MSRPILSRPRTRVYGCNYDKGESYYKPMVDHLDRKYSSRPLFSEPRNSFADEIAARRSDIGSRSLAGNRNDSFDDLDFLYDFRGRSIPEEEYDDDYSIAQRRFKERAAAAFADGLAELRRKRRDMQDRFFDTIDLNAEIKKAKNTLASADVMFQRHAMKFDNTDDVEIDMSLAQRIARRKKLETLDIPEQRKPKQSQWAKLVPLELTETSEPSKILRARLNSIIADNILTENPGETQPQKRRSLSKRKKSVSF